MLDGLPVWEALFSSERDIITMEVIKFLSKIIPPLLFILAALLEPDDCEDSEEHKVWDDWT